MFNFAKNLITNKKYKYDVRERRNYFLKWFKAYSYILLGTFIMAVKFVMFISPYKFAPNWSL